MLSSELGLSWLEDVSRHHCIVHLIGLNVYDGQKDGNIFLQNELQLFWDTLQENLKCELAVYWKVSQG